MTAADPPVAIVDHAQGGVLELRWADGLVARLPHALLRQRCRCAACEQLRRRGGADAQVPVSGQAAGAGAAPAVRLADIRPFGNGVNLVFDDGHGRGIYPWPYLREIAAAAAR